MRGCLAAGVDVNAQSVIGTTPLHYAAFYTDDPAIIRVLLDAGADENAQDLLGFTPLHWRPFGPALTLPSLRRCWMPGPT